MENSLFEEFEKTSSKLWKQQIQADLKGLDYNETLIWKTSEGIDVKPFYHPDQFQLPFSSFPSKGKTWKVGQIIKFTSEEDTNKLIFDAFEHGAEHVLIDIKNESVNLKELFQNVDFNAFKISIRINFESQEFTKSIHEIARGSGCEKTSYPTVFSDPIYHLMKTGNWFRNGSSDLKDFKNTIVESKSLAVDTSIFQNAGASIVQQLAYGLAQLNEYLNYIDQNESGFKFDDLQIEFHTAIGSNYFFEIAKLRALRKLWASLSETYNCNSNCSISAKPSMRNKSIYDYNVNMLRTTTECMSAILGAADTIYNVPYDELYHKPNEFGTRIARNQLLILKAESYFDKVLNPADGSYYIEYLTDELANKALSLFKSIEQSDGFITMLKAGTIQKKIKEKAKQEQDTFDAGELVLLGVNKYPNENDSMKNNLEVDPFRSPNEQKVLIEPIIEKRLSEKLEINRLKKE